MKKALLFIFSLLFTYQINAQVGNDDCVNATPLSIPASGSVCVTGTTANALGTTYNAHGCYPTFQDIPDVWYSFIATGIQNTITVTPNGGTPAQLLGITISDFPCTSTSSSACDLANSNGAAASITYSYGVGTQVWINVSSVVAQGGFQLCVNSVTPPPAPGGSCATATTLCNKNNFSLNTFPGNTDPLRPSCFGNTFQDPVFYQFTVGQTGSCEWTCQPQGNATELDWVMYDITSGCPNNGTAELACNFFYAGADGDPAGMSSTLSTAPCPITNGAGPNSYEFCDPAALVAGRTYLLIIDNYSNISGETDGFDFSWGGTFTIAPTPQFTMSSNTSCSPPLDVSFTNTSTTTVSQTWNFGNGNTSTAVTPPVQTYTATGNYIVSLIGTSATGCQDVYTQNITIGTPPTVTVPTNTTVCAGATIPAAVFTSVPSGATFAWTNSNTAIGLAASGNANIASFTATNTTSAAITSTITVTPTINGCSGLPVSYTITVDPLPSLTAITSQSVCVGLNTTAINYVVAPATSVIDWTNSNTAIGAAASGTGDIASFVGTNTGATAISGSFVATPSLNGCIGTPRTFTITINPLPVPTASNTGPYCEGTTISLTATGGGTYAWTGPNGFTSTSATPTIPAATTAMAGTYSVTVTALTCTATATSSVTINPLPVATASNTGPYCAGATISLSATGGGTYAWTGPNGFTSTSADPTILSSTTAMTGAYSVTVTVLTCTATATSSVTVNPIPVPTASNTGPYCEGTTINLTATGGGTYAWTGPNGFTSTLATPTIPSATAAMEGTYSVTVTALTCTATATSSVTINPLPSLSPIASQTICPGSNTNDIIFVSNPSGATVGWTNTDGNIGIGTTGSGDILAFAGTNTGATAITGNFVATPTLNTCIGPTQNFSITIDPLPIPVVSSNGPRCVNETLQLNASGGTSYSWTGPNSYSSTTQNPSILNVDLTMAGDYIVTVSMGSTCVSTATVTVIVNPLPIVNISSNSPVCENGTINFTSSGGTSYSWSGPIGFLSNAQNPSLSPASLPMAGNYTVNVTDGNGCDNANVTAVVVNPIPLPPVTLSVTYCQNDIPVALTATNDVGGTLNWYGTNVTGGIPSATAPTPSTANAGSTTYYVSQSILNCESPRSSLPVDINPLPTGNLAAVTSDCAPVCRDFTLSSTSTIVNYVWNMGNGTIVNSSPTLNNCYNEPGSYSINITVTDNLGCVASLPFPSWINAYQNPVAIFNYNPQPVTILDPTVTFINESIGSNIITYNWNFGDPLNTTASGQITSFTYPSIGTYLVEFAVMTINGCVDTIYKPIEVLEEFTIYIPNSFSPNGDDLNEEFYPLGVGISSEKYNFQIFDRWGELIFSTTDVNMHWDGKRKGHDNIVQEDTYIYKLSCRSFKGEKFSKSGHVNVIR